MTPRPPSPPVPPAVPKPPSPPPGNRQPPKTSVVSIILDEPIQSGDKFELQGASRSYSGEIISVTDAKPLVTGERFITFKIQPDSMEYNLFHHRAKGIRRRIFFKTPLQNLTKAGKRSPFAKYYWPIASQVPKRLDDRYGKPADVDPDLIQASPVLVDLEDPELEL